MHSEDTTISKFNQYQKSDKAPSIAYADLECIVENTDECKNNPKNLSTTKLSEHIPLGFSMSIISSIRSIENKCDVYRGNDCLDKSLEFLWERAIKIINFKKKKMKLLTKEQQKSYENSKNSKLNIRKIKNIVKLRIIVITQEKIEVLHIAYVI